MNDSRSQASYEESVMNSIAILLGCMLIVSNAFAGELVRADAATSTQLMPPCPSCNSLGTVIARPTLVPACPGCGVHT
jgi:hypothetical protein